MKRSFWYHYNKPASKLAGKPKLTIHQNKSCKLVDGVVCKVDTFSRNRKTQPHLVIAGKGSIMIINNIAYIS